MPTLNLILPNLVPIRKRLSLDHRDRLDKGLQNAVWWTIMQVSDPEAALKVLDQVLGSYPWGRTAVVKLVSDALAGPLAKVNPTSLDQFLGQLQHAGLDIVPDLLNNTEREHVRAALVGICWDQLKPAPLGGKDASDSWCVDVLGETWLVHKWSLVPSSLPILQPKEAGILEGWEPYRVWVDSTKHGIVAVRRYVRGPTFRDWIESDDFSHEGFNIHLAELEQKLVGLHANGFSHGNVKLSNAILRGTAFDWVDEKPEAFAGPDGLAWRIGCDRQLFKELAIDAVTTRYPNVPRTIQDGLRRKIAALDTAQVVEEVSLAMEKEDVRKYLEELMGESVFQDDLHDQVKGYTAQVADQFTSLEAEISKLKQEIRDLGDEIPRFRRELEDMRRQHTLMQQRVQEEAYSMQQSMRKEPEVPQRGRSCRDAVLIVVASILIVILILFLAGYFFDVRLPVWPFNRAAAIPTLVPVDVDPGDEGAEPAAGSDVGQPSVVAPGSEEPAPPENPLPVDSESSIEKAASCQDGMTFVANVEVLDAQEIQPGATFDKVWRVKNTGTCEWGEGYRLSFVGDGNRMNGSDGPREAPVPVTSPEQETELRLQAQAPTAPGTHTENWQTVNSEGEVFGPVLTIVIRVP